MSDGPEWFAPKRYGFGAGLPISWQGWAVSLAYVAVLGAALFLLRDRIIAFAAILVPITVLYILIASRTTRGGWRWRWGGEE